MADWISEQESKGDSLPRRVTEAIESGILNSGVLVTPTNRPAKGIVTNRLGTLQVVAEKFDGLKPQDRITFVYDVLKCDYRITQEELDERVGYVQCFTLDEFMAKIPGLYSMDNEATRPQSFHEHRERLYHESTEPERAGGGGEKFYKINQILDALRRGNSRTTACKAAGVSLKTVNTWALEDVEFAQEMEAAEAESEMEDVDFIKRDRSWQSKSWRLERRNPTDWGNKQKSDMDDWSKSDVLKYIEASTKPREIDVTPKALEES